MWPRDEEPDPEQDVPRGHGEEGVDPGPDPADVVRGGDGPDEADAARGDGPRGVAGEEVADHGELVRDADAGGEEHDGAVGVQGVTAAAAVGAFDEGGEGDAVVVVGALERFAVELVCEAGAAADDEGDGGLGEREGVDCWGRG